MADTEYSSLREAVNRIVGAPPGGTPQQADQAVELAPKASYSQDLQTPTTTTTAISNTPYDPYAAQAAQQAASLAAITTQNNQLAAQLAPAAQAAPAAATAPPLLSYDRYLTRESERNQGRAMPKAATAIGYNQYYLAEPRSSPLTRDQYAKTVNDQYQRAGWNRQGIVQPDQRLIDTGYQSYLGKYGGK